MRKLLVAAVLAVAAVTVAVLMSMSGDGHGARGDGADEESGGTADVNANERRATRTTAPEPPPAAGDGDTSPTPTREAAARMRKLIYQDGTPVSGVKLQRAVGRPLLTKIFRNGDYPEKRVWLVTRVEFTWTERDGSFRFPRAWESGVLYTEADSPAFLLAEFEESVTEYRATRRVEVTGKLQDTSGSVADYHWLSAQKGWPEDYDTRNVKENDSFVGHMGDLEIDPLGKQDTETDKEGRFTLRMLPGRNTLSFGEWRQDGTTNIEVPAGRGKCDLGAISLPVIPTAPARKQTLHGRVLDVSGRPHAHVLVRLWDGVVGEASHETRTNTDGEWSLQGLTGTRVIAWALSPMQKPHVILPAQSSGTIRMPYNAPVILRAPAEDEYCWMRSPGVGGFFLFIRDGVFLGGDVLMPTDSVGLPAGSYHIVVVSNDGIRETTKTVGKGGKLELRKFTRG